MKAHTAFKLLSLVLCSGALGSALTFYHFLPKTASTDLQQQKKPEIGLIIVPEGPSDTVVTLDKGVDSASAFSRLSADAVQEGMDKADSFKQLRESKTKRAREGAARLISYLDLLKEASGRKLDYTQKINDDGNLVIRTNIMTAEKSNGILEQNSIVIIIKPDQEYRSLSKAKGKDSAYIFCSRLAGMKDFPEGTDDVVVTLIGAAINDGKLTVQEAAALKAKLLGKAPRPAATGGQGQAAPRPQ